MVTRLAEYLQQLTKLSPQHTLKIFQRGLVGLAATTFVVIATLTVAYDDIFVGLNDTSTLRVGDISPRNIVAPQTSTYVSQILTEEARENARQAIQAIYDPPDPNVARQQTQLAQQILAFMLNVRRDPYGTPAQKTADLNAITALTLDPPTAQNILQFSDEAWTAINDEVLNVMSLVMRESIRTTTIQTFRDQLSNQVSIRFNPQERAVIVAIVEDLIRPNTFENVDTTQRARDDAATKVPEVTRSFVRGERILGTGELISAADFEALQALGVLRPPDVRFQEIVRVFALTTIVMVMTGLYLIRFDPRIVYTEARLLTLVAACFLGMLIALRFLGLGGNIYLFPASALALLFVAIAGAHTAIISALGLGLLTGVMANNSLEYTTLVGAGSLIGVLVLRNTERLNSFFVAGALIGTLNAALVATFSLANAIIFDPDVVGNMVLAMLSGVVLVPATAIASMYILTQLFNLTTALKLLDLSQPSKPLLQRLLREAPGTYQHSLQVANLSEQAAHAIGADAQLIHVAALYHDIGKMLNPLYFTENQQDIVNPHDTLNDPYRSATIIIGHVTEGDILARQYRLPARLRDFILEHHGTTQVFVFYQRAINQAEGDTSAVDISDFTYPGPRPRSKETAIMMIADSCEATVRAVKPQSRQEIADIVNKIIDDKRKNGQLDDSGLTLNDLNIIRNTFVDVLQGMFHPRINYMEAIAKKPPQTAKTTSQMPKVDSKTPTPPRLDKVHTENGDSPTKRTVEMPVQRVGACALEDEEPMTEVPRLPRSAEEARPQIEGESELKDD